MRCCGPEPGLPGGDGWISLVPADLAPLLLPEPLEAPERALPCSTCSRVAGDVLPRAVRRVGATDDTALADLVWDLVWAGALTNDTLGPAAHPARRRHAPQPARRPRARGARGGRARLGRPAMPTRTGLPTVAGRWSRLPEREANATRRTTARAEALLERHGVHPRRGDGRAGDRRLLADLPGAARSRRTGGPAAATSSRRSAPPSSAPRIGRPAAQLRLT